MPFFEYSQNNSGGSFAFSRKRGISVHVIVEADTAEDADRRAESIGLYFDGIERGLDCDCCGDRWHSARGEGDEVPSIHGTPASEYLHTGKAPETFIHYANGRKVAVQGRKRVRK